MLAPPVLATLLKRPRQLPESRAAGSLKRDMIDEIDSPSVPTGRYRDDMMMTAEPMITRGAHYTALLETIDHQGAGKLHAREREQLLEAADVLLFGEPDSEWTVRSAEVLIEALQTSERWSVESCDQLREHLSGCGAPTGES